MLKHQLKQKIIISFYCRNFFSFMKTNIKMSYLKLILTFLEITYGTDRSFSFLFNLIIKQSVFKCFDIRENKYMNNLQLKYKWAFWNGFFWYLFPWRFCTLLVKNTFCLISIAAFTQIEIYNQNSSTLSIRSTFVLTKCFDYKIIEMKGLGLFFHIFLSLFTCHLPLSTHCKQIWLLFCLNKFCIISDYEFQLFEPHWTSN